jgi:cellulose synthase/poly-beta-1,6-N-acetylglucosamine synthase-like glycosyltransferase
MQPGPIGVVIRTLNESALIGRCLETLQQQRPGFNLDILVVDSGSTDATVAIAESHGARILPLAPGEFDYSRALNVGIDAVRGEIVLILSAHAIPVDDRWIGRMLAPFEDPSVAGVASRQVPWDDAPWDEVQRLARTFGLHARRFTGDDQDEVLFSNAASAIRRRVWESEPFTLPAAEDLDWARRVVAAGWTVVYEPAAAAYHSHNESARAKARRLIDVNRVDHGHARPRTRRRTLREAAGLLARDGRAIARLDEPLRRKVVHLAQAASVCSYYVLDFSRSGTTAERRREDAAGTA